MVESKDKFWVGVRKAVESWNSSLTWPAKYNKILDSYIILFYWFVRLKLQQIFDGVYAAPWLEWSIHAWNKEVFQNNPRLHMILDCTCTSLFVQKQILFWSPLYFENLSTIYPILGTWPFIWVYKRCLYDLPFKSSGLYKQDSQGQWSSFSL